MANILKACYTSLYSFTLHSLQQENDLYLHVVSVLKLIHSSDKRFSVCAFNRSQTFHMILSNCCSYYFTAINIFHVHYNNSYSLDAKF